MPTMDECRRKAEECLRWADEAANDRQRETLLEIARLWTQMEYPALNQMVWTGRLRSQGFQRRQSHSPGPQGAKGGFDSQASQGFKSRHTSRVFEGRRGQAAQIRLLLLLLQTIQERN
jgi:hypothetical protein